MGSAVPGARCAVDAGPRSPAAGQACDLAPTESARIAIYDAAGAPPRVEEVAPVETGEYISMLATRTYELSRALGGRVPFTVISEIVENYIHAGFRGPVVTILDSGDTIRFSDQGPGIREKERALRPGYTTASPSMKRFIRGVGSGLPLARECLSFGQGTLEVEDNIGEGAVVTVSVAQPSSIDSPPGECASVETTPAEGAPPAADAPRADLATAPDPSAEFRLFASSPRLSNRQKRVLALVMDSGTAGPSLVARELAIGLSTAYRDLAYLEDLGFITADETGKRSLTGDGAEYLQSLLNAGV